MNRQDMLWVRSQIIKEYNVADRIIIGIFYKEHQVCTKVFSDVRDFRHLEEEEHIVYQQKFRKSLSGGLGKNAYSIACENDVADSLMNQIRTTCFLDGKANEEFLQNIADVYPGEDGYFAVIGLHGKLDGADYVLCMICPAAKDAAKLVYNIQKNSVEDGKRNYVIKDPEIAVLYPSYDERMCCISEALYYAKKPHKNHDELLYALTRAHYPATHDHAKDWFARTLAGMKVTPEQIKNIQDKLKEQVYGGEFFVSSPEVKSVLRECGVREDDLKTIEYEYKKEFKEEGVPVTGLLDIDKVVVDTGSYKINMPENMKYLLEVEEVNGRKCLVLPLPSSTFQLNGITVTTNK